MVGVLRSVLFVLTAIFLAACGAAERRAEFPPAATPSPAATPTRTPTATPTPTPTATAPPAVVQGDLRALILSEPVRQGAAPCGFVDTLDFPLDPPDAEAASGGGDFGRFRERYDGFHAGEDWRLGQSSFGQPVYGIAHGRVMYAQPLGWGADKGVVIVEHTFRGGRRLLSFYGHLDPPSVVLRAGQCIERGDQVGAIGDPRSSPHLHFEIRVHLPDTPGPGYWPSDPRQAGWRPPSATIWFERMAALPGVNWGQLHNDGVLLPLGAVDGNVLVSGGAGELQALDVDDGSVRWSRSLPAPADNLLLDAQSRVIYSASSEGVVEAFSTSALERGELEVPLWNLDLGEFGRPELAPLPGGGLVVLTRSAMLGVSVQGEVLWSGEPAQWIIDWAESGAGLILLTRQGTWQIGREQAAAWPASIAGQKVVASDVPYLYAQDGLYRLSPELQSAELLYALPWGYPRSGDVIELPGGGLLVAHSDPADTRLIAVEADGSLRWERSVASLGPRTVELMVVDGQAYAAMRLDLGNATGIDIFHVQEADGRLTRVFSGGSRFSSSDSMFLTVAGDSVLISIADVGVFGWDTHQALQTVLEGQPPDG